MKYATISPNVINPLYKSYSEIQSSNLDKDLIILVELRTSQINRCSYCCSLHTNEGLLYGIKKEKLDTLSNWITSNTYTAKEKLALEWCEAITKLSECSINDIKPRIEIMFSEKDLVDLTACISLMNTLNRMAIIFN